MRALNRLPKPQKLIDKEVEWLNNFYASGLLRPASAKYGHIAIRNSLNSMSFHKCFYCETKLKNRPKEVDHFVEVSINKGLAFSWDNLYLSCDNCNNKLDDVAVPVVSVLDPCNTSDVEIEAHLTFKDELIGAMPGSQIGLDTIRKYRLDTPQLDSLRLISLKEFLKELLKIRDAQIAEMRNYLSPNEVAILTIYKQQDQPYSFMFRKYLGLLGL